MALHSLHKPKPKPKRSINVAARIDVRENRDGACLYGMMLKDGCDQILDVHHIHPRGAGGDDNIKNLITLCRKHHNKFHAGLEKKYVFYYVLHYFYGYTYDDIVVKCPKCSEITHHKLPSDQFECSCGYSRDWLNLCIKDKL